METLWDVLKVTLAKLQIGLVRLIATILSLSIHFPMQFTLTVSTAVIQYKHHQHEKHLPKRIFEE